TSSQFGLGAGLLFISYCLFEIPSNLVLYRVGPRRWLARIMITWGIISASTAFVVGPRSFYAARLLLGAAEAGYFVGVTYYLSAWFPVQVRTLGLAYRPHRQEGGQPRRCLLSRRGRLGGVGGAHRLAAGRARWLDHRAGRRDLGACHLLERADTAFDRHRRRRRIGLHQHHRGIRRLRWPEHDGLAQGLDRLVLRRLDGDGRYHAGRNAARCLAQTSCQTGVK